MLVTRPVVTGRFPNAAVIMSILRVALRPRDARELGGEAVVCTIVLVTGLHRCDRSRNILGCGPTVIEPRLCWREASARERVP